MSANQTADDPVNIPNSITVLWPRACKQKSGGILLTPLAHGRKERHNKL